MARPRGSMALQVEGASLADALETFPRRKTNRTVRALLQNCAALSPWGFSFRRWLEHACASLGAGSFPPSDFLAEASDGVVAASIERVLRRRIEQSFYQVGPALAAYMLSDWQLGAVVCGSDRGIRYIQAGRISRALRPTLWSRPNPDERDGVRALVAQTISKQYPKLPPGSRTSASGSQWSRGQQICKARALSQPVGGAAGTG